MKWRHWSILIVLVLLNYIIFSSAFMQLAEQRKPKAPPTRTPQPTFVSVESKAVSWVVLPTCTAQSTPTPRPPQSTPTPGEVITQTEGLIASVEVTEAPTMTPLPTDTPAPTPTPTAELVIHVVKRGEYLSGIAKEYGVTSRAIADANEIENPNLIITGQRLIIPNPGQEPAVIQPTVTSTPVAPLSPSPVPSTATPTPRPPAASPTATTVGSQFTGNVVWNPMIAPNCSGPAISKESIIQDMSGNPVNGVRVEVECYGNEWLSHPSGNPGEYEPGHYDFAFGQNEPQAWTCSARVFDINGQLVTSSQTVTIQFDTNDCLPGGTGHQVAIVNWTKHW
ncbi:MAG: LysM peptidoglycan-binding domain-containing protein [Anaerolineae bacterium]